VDYYVGSYLTIPTAIIPLDLRKIGSKFLLVSQFIQPPREDSYESLMDAIHGSVEVQRLEEKDIPRQSTPSPN
jgi:hypothetical protein